MEERAVGPGVVGSVPPHSFLALTWCCQGPKPVPGPTAEDHKMAIWPDVCGFLLTALQTAKG